MKNFFSFLTHNWWLKLLALALALAVYYGVRATLYYGSPYMMQSLMRGPADAIDGR
ncbi:MAG: hypothetical protein IJ146_09220 [Kiritimatiellae bacterium]|jgi:hypothetical protein|nr:hypothetical protein [Kiritimatiellia bacterium]